MLENICFGLLVFYIYLGLKTTDKYKNSELFKGNGSNIDRGLTRICI